MERKTPMMHAKARHYSFLIALSLLLLTVVIFIQKQQIKSLEKERDDYRHNMQNYRQAYETEQRRRAYLMHDLEKLNEPVGCQIFLSPKEVHRVWVRHIGGQ